MSMQTATLKLTSSFQSLFGGAVPSATEYIVIGLRAANIDGNVGVVFEVVFDPASGDDAHLAAVNTPLAPGATEPLVQGDYFRCGPGDDIKAKSTGSNLVSLIVTYKSFPVA